MNAEDLLLLLDMVGCAGLEQVRRVVSSLPPKRELKRAPAPRHLRGRRGVFHVRGSDIWRERSRMPNLRPELAELLRSVHVTGITRKHDPVGVQIEGMSDIFDDIGLNAEPVFYGINRHEIVNMDGDLVAVRFSFAPRGEFARRSLERLIAEHQRTRARPLAPNSEASSKASGARAGGGGEEL